MLWWKHNRNLFLTCNNSPGSISKLEGCSPPCIDSGTQAPSIFMTSPCPRSLSCAKSRLTTVFRVQAQRRGTPTLSKTLVQKWHFCSHPIGKNLVTWPHLTARDPGKYTLAVVSTTGVHCSKSDER